MLEARLARAQAGLGDREDCLRTLDRMRANFDQAGSRDEPLWVSYVDLVEITAQAGACYLDLGMTDDAATALTDAVALLKQCTPHRVRDQVHYLSRLAKCHLRAGEIEQACQTATDALLLVVRHAVEPQGVDEDGPLRPACHVSQLAEGSARHQLERHGVDLPADRADVNEGAVDIPEEEVGGRGHEADGLTAGLGSVAIPEATGPWP